MSVRTSSNWLMQFVGPVVLVQFCEIECVLQMSDHFNADSKETQNHLASLQWEDVGEADTAVHLTNGFIAVLLILKQLCLEVFPGSVCVSFKGCFYTAGLTGSLSLVIFLCTVLCTQELLTLAAHNPRLIYAALPLLNHHFLSLLMQH